MITINSNKINTFDQISYNKLINSIDFSKVRCSCKHYGTLTKHAYYNRNIKISGGIMLTLSILRVKCDFCGRTHAVIPAFIIPFSQVSLNDHIVIISNYLNKHSQDSLMFDNPLIDESNIAYIIRNFKRSWAQRLLSYKILFSNNFSTLSELCFKYFNRQFMQIKCTTNIFYYYTHIT